MTGDHDPLLVAVSVLVAMGASYTALDMAGRVSAARARPRVGWLVAGSVAMGTGIWSMHFIAMLAFKLPVPVGYDVPLVLLSGACAIAASLLALVVASQPRLRIRSIIVGGLLMGPAIAGMHYIGMAAMRLPPPSRRR
jgi:NO-binding membrane sensor protein with MHYT domain